MKTIPVELLNEQLTTALEQQDEHEAIGLTTDSGTVAWVVRVPDALKGSEADVVMCAEGPTGLLVVVLRAKHVSPRKPEGKGRTPVFGAGCGAMTIVSEDDEHLKEFHEYME